MADDVTGAGFRLLRGDCLERLDELAPASVDMVLTDLPYGTTRCKWDTVIDLPSLLAQFRRVCKPNAAIVLFSAEPFTSALVMSNPRMFRYDLIWKKEQGTDFLNANRKPLKAHENILVFYDRAPVFHKQKTQGTPYKPNNKHKGTDCYGDFKLGYFVGSPDGMRNPITVINCKRERGLHPTQKPVALCEWLIKTYTDAGALVLDATMGSGTTGAACANTGRRFVGIELDAAYFDAAAARIGAAYG